jgi:phage baseplate assembly protein V
MRRKQDNDGGELGELIRFGTVAEVDGEAGELVLDCGDVRTGPIPWLERRAGTTRTRSDPSVGEQALLLCPDGDVEGAIALVGVSSDASPLPGASGVELIEFEDGAALSYDPAAHILEVKLPAGATVKIEATGGVTLDASDGGLSIKGDVAIEGNVSIEGDAQVSGTATADTDVVGGGKSLKGHKHLGVTAGQAVSGIPQ